MESYLKTSYFVYCLCVCLHPPSPTFVLFGEFSSLPKPYTYTRALSRFLSLSRTHTHTRTCKRTHTHAHTHARTQTRTHTRRHKCSAKALWRLAATKNLKRQLATESTAENDDKADIREIEKLNRALAHTHTHTKSQTRQTHSHKDAHAHTNTHANTHTRTRTHTQTHTHTRTHANTPAAGGRCGVWHVFEFP